MSIETGYRLADNSRQLRRLFDERVGSLGITGPQARLLLSLERSPNENQAFYAERLEIEPITGRSHQIRLHLATLGHPLLGDPLYADDDTLRMAPRLLLHATSLAVAHPDDGRPVAWQSVCPF